MFIPIPTASRVPQLRRLPRIPTWGHCLNYQYYQLKPSPCVIKHLGLSVFSCYLLIISYLTQASLYLQIRMTYYIVFQFAYLDVNPCWFSVQWLNTILNYIRAIRVLCYANELVLVCDIESQSFQGGRHVRYPYRLLRLVISSNHIDKESLNPRDDDC